MGPEEKQRQRSCRRNRERERVRETEEGTVKSLTFCGTFYVNYRPRFVDDEQGEGSSSRRTRGGLGLSRSTTTSFARRGGKWLILLARWPFSVCQERGARWHRRRWARRAREDDNTGQHNTNIHIFSCVPLACRTCDCLAASVCN